MPVASYLDPQQTPAPPFASSSWPWPIDVETNLAGKPSIVINNCLLRVKDALTGESMVVGIGSGKRKLKKASCTT